MGKNDFEKMNVAFITCGDIFSAGEETWITGVATTKLKVKEVLKFEGQMFRIIDMKIVGKNSIKKVKPMEQCALCFRKVNKEEFKELVNNSCVRERDLNIPFDFGSGPSSLYTCFYSK